MQFGERFVQVGDALRVDFHGLYLARLLYKILREHTHTWPNFQNGDAGTGVNRVGYAAGDVQVGQEVLAQILFRLYLLHTAVVACCATKLRKKEQCPALSSAFISPRHQKHARQSLYLATETAVRCSFRRPWKNIIAC